ncbi:hypothetical protein [Geotalea uraniireducens]|uniref:hypothetical protein n=1 Tax=Geotalea uraniireducens TaxID=351604 RepID=UPI0024906597|nr:hypothetical protein [Geotalea uraniireducens]
MDRAPDKKHPCPDCRHCQWCGDDRCALCLRPAAARRKLSMAEQIALYEALNNPTSPTRSEPPDDQEETDR